MAKTSTKNQESNDNFHLFEVLLDEESFSRSSPDIEHERAAAIFDIIEKNSFRINGPMEGPYSLKISLIESRLSLQISNKTDENTITHILSLTPFRKIIKDYFLICESYFEAIKTCTPSQIEAIDMGRRGVHNDGSELLQERLKDKIELDFQTARRLFTLICALHWKG